jgi:fumarylpyruvate hydrolase
MATVYCVGRNFAAHAREMGAAPGPLVVFLKPEGAVVPAPAPITWPRGVEEVHHEAELVARVGPDLGAEAVAVGLDLTDRPRQAAAKAEGLPWAAAKGFRGSAPVGPFVPADALPPLDRLRFTLTVNGEVRQRGDARDMLRPIAELLAEIDRWFGLRPGDLLFTGTPEGIGPLRAGDRLSLAIDGAPAAEARFTVRGPLP